MYDSILIDGKNCLYRAIYAGLSDNFFVASGNSYCVIFFRFISNYLQRFKPNSIHVFWESNKQNTWRRLICPEYKEGRISRYENIDEVLGKNLVALKQLLPNMNCRMYELPNQEADDLIYAFCRVRSQSKILIVSSDGDFKQISYEYANIDVFNPLNKNNSIFSRELKNLVEIKSYMGEKGDNIDGYDKIGPVHAEELSIDFQKRVKFFSTNDKSLYLRNRRLIDLSLCPYLLENMEYIKDKLAENISFNIKEIMRVIQTYKIKGLSTEVHRTILPFKFIGRVRTT